MSYVFRWGGPQDYAALAEIMYDAVRNGPSEYNDQQRAAWMPRPREGNDWESRLATQQVLLGEREGQAEGFMTLADGGYIDFAYIRPGARGRGLFRQLFERIEQRARGEGIGMLWVHASLAAQLAFAAVGFRVRRHEEVAIGTERLARAEMEKDLSA